MTPEQDKMLRDVHGYLFSTERGKKRPTRSEEIDIGLDSIRYSKWTARFVLYIAGFIAAVAGAWASVKGVWK